MGSGEEQPTITFRDIQKAVKQLKKKAPAKMPPFYITVRGIEQKVFTGNTWDEVAEQVRAYLKEREQ